MRMRRPIRANVDTMFSRFFDIKEHPAPEDAKQGGAPEGDEDVIEDEGCGVFVSYDVAD